ncbi:hypothetical protein [Streptomyces sp. NPDC000134]|uniref:hypothetical protein n=1 Tax=Streptomyces sp. NPDC000134 TaxID=3364536 RepID=UPI0036B0D0CB
MIATVTAMAPASAVTVADDGGKSRTTLVDDVDIPAGLTTRVLARTVHLAAGESRHVRGRIDTTSSMTQIAGLTLTVRCVDAAGGQVGFTGATARNHEGSDAASYADPGHLPLYADLLFTAPSAGTYTCGVHAWTASSASSTYHLTATADNTWMEISNTDQRGARWWANPTCSSDGTSPTCSYVGPWTSTPAWVFYTDGTPVYKWAAAADATAVEALANVTLTTCYRNTASCQSSSVVPHEQPRGTNSVVDTRFEVIQLDTTAHTCKVHSTPTTRRTIRDDAHHYATYFSLAGLPIDPACGTRQFIMRVYVKHVSGNPVKIDGLQGATQLTHGIAMNLTS